MGDSRVSLRFLVDEDVPRSTARVLCDAGFDAVDVRDVGLRGKSDQLVFDYAQRENRLLVTCDLGFSNIILFPPSQSVGLLVVRIPDSEPIETFNREVLKAVQEIGVDLQKRLVLQRHVRQLDAENSGETASVCYIWRQFACLVRLKSATLRCNISYC